MSDASDNLADLRKQLDELSERYWGDYQRSLEERSIPADADLSDLEVEARFEGAFVTLHGVDFTRQGGSGEDRIIVHREADRGWWAIAMNDDYRKLVARLREVQKALGLTRDDRERWDVAGRFLEHGYQVGTWDLDMDGDMPLISAASLRVRGQLAVFLHPEKGAVVPGWASAQARLDSIQGGDEDVPDVAEPKDLIGPLMEVLAASNRALFTKWWVSGTSESSLGYSYRQFRQAWESSAGDVAFERYDARENPDNYPDCGAVKMFVKRTNEDGSTVSRPVTFVKDAERWRLKSGMI